MTPDRKKSFCTFLSGKRKDLMTLFFARDFLRVNKVSEADDHTTNRNIVSAEIILV